MMIRTIIVLCILAIPLLQFSQHNQWNYQGEASLAEITGKEIHKYKVNGTCTKFEFSRWMYDGYYSNVSNTPSVSGYSISCNYDYTTSYEYDNYGNTKVTLTVRDIPKNATIDFTTNYYASTGTYINGFNPLDPSPPSTHGVPPEYLQPSPNAQSDNQTIASKAQSLTSSHALMVGAVEAIARWVDGNIAYRADGAQDAISVYSTTHPNPSLGGVGSGNCAGFTNLMIAMLRSVGIPARYVGGEHQGTVHANPPVWLFEHQWYRWAARHLRDLLPLAGVGKRRCSGAIKLQISGFRDYVLLSR